MHPARIRICLHVYEVACREPHEHGRTASANKANNGQKNDPVDMLNIDQIRSRECRPENELISSRSSEPRSRNRGEERWSQLKRHAQTIKSYDEGFWPA